MAFLFSNNFFLRRTYMSTLMSGARMLAECLAREGVDCMFGYPGGVTLPFYDVLYDHQIRHVLVRHEENAAFAAEGYARFMERAENDKTVFRPSHKPWKSKEPIPTFPPP